MTGAGKLDEAMIAKARKAAGQVIGIQIRCARLGAPELARLAAVHDQRGRGDAPPEGHAVFEMERSVERHRREHGIELPFQRSVLARPRSEQRQLARLALAESRVALAQAVVGTVEVLE